MRFRDERGFGIVEVMTGAFIMLVGALAVLSVLMASSKASTSVNRQEVAAHQAEKQIEWVRSLPYDKAWLASVPTASTNPKNPASRITGSGTNARYRVGGDAARPEQLVTSGSTANSWAGINPGTATPVTFTVGSGSQAVSGKIYTFVSWRDQECPLLKLGDVNSALSAASPILSNASTVANTLTNTLVGQLGSLLNATAKKLTGVTSDVNSLPTLRALLNSTTTSISTLRASSAFQSALAGGLDLCDLSLSQVQAFKRLTSVPTAVQTLFQSVTDPDSLIKHNANAQSVVNGLGGVLCTVLSVLSLCDENLNSEAGLTYADVGAMKTAAQSLLDDVNTVSGLLTGDPTNTVQNTKRITVGVTIDSDRTDVAPQKPVWSSTIVSDPDAGIG